MTYWRHWFGCDGIRCEKFRMRITAWIGRIVGYTKLLKQKREGITNARKNRIASKMLPMGTFAWVGYDTDDLLHRLWWYGAHEAGTDPDRYPTMNVSLAKMASIGICGDCSNIHGHIVLCYILHIWHIDHSRVSEYNWRVGFHGTRAWVSVVVISYIFNWHLDSPE